MIFRVVTITLIVGLILVTSNNAILIIFIIILGDCLKVVIEYRIVNDLVTYRMAISAHLPLFFLI